MLLSKFAQLRWPHARVLFRPVRLDLDPNSPAESISSVNYCYGVVYHILGPLVHEFTDMATGEKYKGEVSVLINTPLGKEMDALEAEVDSYISAPYLTNWVHREIGEQYCDCFDAAALGELIHIRSKPGKVSWSIDVVYKDRLNDIIAAEQFIAARRIWLRARDAIRILPQPIAEEIEEQFEFF